MTTKAQRLSAAYERFAVAIADIPDAKAQELYRVAAGVPQFVADARLRNPAPTTSQSASGLEQGLREMPRLVGEVEPQWRWAVARALNDAVSTEYPEFLAVEAERLRNVVARGKIRTDAEFYLVRYQIDVLEGEPDLGAELTQLYALVDAYEVRA